MKKDRFVIGVDYGTDSVRSVILNALNGNEVASSVFYYPRWRDGLYCEPQKNQFRQHPVDYVEIPEMSLKGTCNKLVFIIILIIIPLRHEIFIKQCQMN